MKVYNKIILTIWGVVILSCSGSPTNSETIAPEKDIEKEANINQEISREEKRKKILEDERLDSLRLDKVLNQALSKVKDYSLNSSFHESFQAFPDSVCNVDVKIDYDYNFSNNKRHLIIHRFSPGAAQIDVFINTKTGLEKILSHKQWAMEYTGDTLTDINGDGLKDFVVNWYGVSGCCLKAFSAVYLIRNDLQSFSKMNEFINPTFSSKERIIRGICYGHPGETELYKYKWSGEKIDTIEYVAFETDDNGKRTGEVIISNQFPNHKDYKIIRKVNKVPTEYKNIDEFSWFNGKI